MNSCHFTDSDLVTESVADSYAVQHRRSDPRSLLHSETERFPPTIPYSGYFNKEDSHHNRYKHHFTS